MASFKTNPLFSTALVVLGLVVLAEGWFIYDRSSAATKSARALASKRNELHALHAVQPAPNDASKAAVEADLVRTQAALATMQEELKGRGPTAERLRTAKAPAEPTDAFFDLANFVEQSREKTTTAGIKIKTDERFGFSTYASAGPDRDLIPQVFLQRQIAQYLIDALIEAKPGELVALQRERPQTQSERAASANAQDGGQAARANASAAASAQGGDFFDIDPRISARVPGFVGASAFRLTFIGQTESLRILLNKLASFELPLVVRGVEVEPVTKNGNGTAAPAANTLSSIFGTVTSTTVDPEKPKPLVEKVLSKFTVTIELIDLVEASKVTP